MKLSNKGRYAIQAIFDLAYHAGDSGAQIKEISERQHIPTRFLEQVFQDLKKAGIVRSKRGPKGGYHLEADPAELRLGDVVRAIEGAVQLTTQKQPGDATSAQVLAGVFAEVGASIEGCFDAVSFADLCARADAMGLARQPASRYVYAI